MTLTHGGTWGTPSIPAPLISHVQEGPIKHGIPRPFPTVSAVLTSEKWQEIALTTDFDNKERTLGISEPRAPEEKWQV